MKKKKVLRVMLTPLLVLSILAGAGYLYNHGMSGKMLEAAAPAEGQRHPPIRHGGDRYTGFHITN